MYPIVIGICGRSASGKDTTATRLVDEYIEMGIPVNKVVSYTTRPPREGEIDGVDYHFVDLETFIDMQYDNKFIEHTKFRGWRYGTAFNSLRDDCINICVLNPVGMTKLQKLCPWSLKCELFYLKVPFYVRLKRSIKREHTFKWEFIRRAFADWEDFSGYDDYFGYVSNQHVLHYRGGRTNFVSSIMNTDELIHAISELKRKRLSK